MTATIKLSEVPEIHNEVLETLITYRYEMQVKMLSMQGLLGSGRMKPKSEQRYRALCARLNKVDLLIKRLK